MEDCYKTTPVEGFGEKVLGKFGWTKGRGIGKSPSGEVKVYEGRKGREDKAGLGSDREAINKKRTEIEVGCQASIVSGKHKGVSGTVMEISQDSAVIASENNKNSLKVPIIALSSIGIELPITSRPVKQLKWVLPGLKIRIRSKTAHNGSLYSSKALIEDVLDSYRFSVRVDQRFIEDLVEKDIETIIPSVGSMAKIVKGSKKGELCKLLARDKKKNQVTIQLLNEVLQMKQDDICDFINE